MRDIIAILAFSLSFCSLFAQDNNIVHISNSSYEATPKHGHLAKEWATFQFEKQTYPDIQPGFFEVITTPQDGQSYLGMVTKPTGTSETIIIALQQPLIANQTYEWSFYLRQSETYESIPDQKAEPESFTAPVKLVVYENTEKGDTLYPIFEIENIHQAHSWQRYRIQFEPSTNARYIYIDIAHQSPESNTNGHILLDHFHPFIAIDSETEKPLSKILHREAALLDIRKIKQAEARIDALVKHIPFDSIYHNGYMDYQLQRLGSEDYTYSNMYWEELIKLAHKNKQKIVIPIVTDPKIHTKDQLKFLRFKNYLEHYTTQHELPDIVKVIETNSTKQKKKYKKYKPLFQNKEISVLISPL